MPFITRAISCINFAVATSALGFQVGVLYPWHKQLDDDFEALKKEHLRVLQAIENINNTIAANGGAGAAVPSSRVSVKPEQQEQEQQQRSQRGMFSGLWGWRQ